MAEEPYEFGRSYWVKGNFNDNRVMGVADPVEDLDAVNLRTLHAMAGIGPSGPITAGPTGPSGADGIDGATGPTGPPGPTAVSAATGNLSVLDPGDGLVFTPNHIDALSDVDTVTVGPALGDALVWDGTHWSPGVSTSQGNIPLEQVGLTTTEPIDLMAAPQYIDGLHPIGSAFTRILVKDQVDMVENGIYIYQGEGLPMVRASDADTENALVVGNTVFVASGATNQGLTFQVSLLAAQLPWNPDVDESRWIATFSKLDIESGAGLHLEGKRMDVVAGNGIEIYNDKVSLDLSVTDQYYARSLHELNDVDVWTTPPADGQGIAWSYTKGKWLPADLGGGDTGSEVEVDGVEPTSDWELWVDTSATGPVMPSPAPARKMARGSFKLGSYGQVLTGYAITEEVIFPPGLFTGSPHLTATFEAWQGAQPPGIIAAPSPFYKVLLTCSAINPGSAFITVYFLQGATLSDSQGIHWLAIE